MTPNKRYYFQLYTSEEGNPDVYGTAPEVKCYVLITDADYYDQNGYSSDWDHQGELSALVPSLFEVQPGNKFALLCEATEGFFEGLEDYNTLRTKLLASGYFTEKTFTV